jgi:hypothetical protein
VYWLKKTIISQPIGSTITILSSIKRHPRRRFEAPSGVILPKNLPIPRRDEITSSIGEKKGRIKNPRSIAALKP